MEKNDENCICKCTITRTNTSSDNSFVVLKLCQLVWSSRDRNLGTITNDWLVARAASVTSFYDVKHLICSFSRNTAAISSMCREKSLLWWRRLWYCLPRWQFWFCYLIVRLLLDKKVRNGRVLWVFFFNYFPRKCSAKEVKRTLFPLCNISPFSINLNAFDNLIQLKITPRERSSAKCKNLLQIGVTFGCSVTFQNSKLYKLTFLKKQTNFGCHGCSARASEIARTFSFPFFQTRTYLP